MKELLACGWLVLKKAILFVIPVAAFVCVEGGSIHSLTRILANILSQIMLSIIIYELMRKEKEKKSVSLCKTKCIVFLIILCCFFFLSFIHQATPLRIYGCICVYY